MRSEKNLALDSLTLAQLETLLSHVRMGESHLKKYLTPSQIKNLLTLNQPSKNLTLRKGN